MYSATSTAVVATSGTTPSVIRRSSSERSTSSATNSIERTMPVPWHMAQELVEPSSMPVRKRWRDISSSPKWLMRPTWMRARSLRRDSFRRRSTSLDVAALVHVDEVDDDEAGEIAQAKLARDFLCRLEIGLERGVLDIVLARRLAGVDVDGDERLGLIDDDIAAGPEHHLRREHRRELPLHLKADEDRLGLLVGLHVLRMARHEHAHEVLGLAIGVVARDQHFVDILVVEVADRALDQAAFLIDEAQAPSISA